MTQRSANCVRACWNRRREKSGEINQQSLILSSIRHQFNAVSGRRGRNRAIRLTRKVPEIRFAQVVAVAEGREAKLRTGDK